MSLFGKGNWSRFAVTPEDLALWTALTANARNLFIASAFGARTLLLGNSTLDTTVGINPPIWPCGDAPYPLEQLGLDRQVHPLVLRNLMNEENETPWILPENTGNDVVDSFDPEDRVFGDKGSFFNLYSPEKAIVGFWLVLHSRAGLDDMNALKEHGAATTHSQPFKTLPPAAKKDLTTSLESDGLVDYIARTQCPVIINFETGSVWVGTTSKKLLDALKFWLDRYAHIALYKVETSFGHNPNFASDAMALFVEKDILKLEREEAYEAAIAEEEVSEEPDEDIDPESVPHPVVDENKFQINSIAIYSENNIQFAEVHTDAVISVGTGHMGSVTAHRPLDAMAILRSIPNSGLQNARVAFKDNVGAGMGMGTVDFGPQVGDGLYKGLELDFNTPAVTALSEAATGRDILDEDTTSTAHGFSSRINRFWFSYYLRLVKFERMMIETTCTVLELDPTGITPAPVGSSKITVLEPGEPAEATGTDGVLAKAVGKMKKSMEANLLPGESVTFGAPGTPGVTIHGGGSPKGHAVSTDVEI